MSAELTPAQVSAWRMRQHLLLRRAPREMLPSVVSKVCGVQAQVLTAAELALRARVEGIRQQDVRDALWKDHSILKTWCMRGTLHLLSTSDLSLYVAALKTKLEGSVNWLGQNEGIVETEVNLIIESIKEALDLGLVLTREQLSRRIERGSRLSTKARKGLRSAWGVLLRPSAYQGYLSFGPNLGPKVTFVNPRRWVKTWRKLESGEAFQELLRRFFGAYGPTETGEFSHWWGNLTAKEKLMSAAFERSVEPVRVAGEEWGLMAGTDIAEAERTEDPKMVKLLPSFDCYAMFYSPRDAFVSEAHRSKIFSKEAGWVFPSLVVDGVAAGVWNMRKSGGRVLVDIQPFRRLTEEERDGVHGESEDIGRFLDLKADTKFAKPASTK